LETNRKITALAAIFAISILTMGALIGSGSASANTEDPSSLDDFERLPNGDYTYIYSVQAGHYITKGVSIPSALFAPKNITVNGSSDHPEWVSFGTVRMGWFDYVFFVSGTPEDPGTYVVEFDVLAVGHFVIVIDVVEDMPEGLPILLISEPASDPVDDLVGKAGIVLIVVVLGAAVLGFTIYMKWRVKNEK